MRVGVIRNPRSGRGAGERAWPKIVARLERENPEDAFIFEQTTAPGSAVVQARELACLGCDVVIACGGDGTVTDVAQGLLGTDTALGILPMGTGNDFARTIGVGPSLEPAFRALRQGGRRRVDVGHWRQGAQEGHFLNVAGCGFDAAVAQRVNQGFRRLRGRAAYLAAVLTELARFRAVPMTLTIDGEPVQVDAMLCAFANARSYGGGMLVAPTAEIDDGLLDVVLVEKLGRMEFLRAFPRVFKGTHLSHPKVSLRQGRHIVVETGRPMPFLVDGELLPPGRVEIDVLPRALTVVCPAQGGA